MPQDARSRASRTTPQRSGDWSDKLQPSMGKNYGFVIKTNELRRVQYINRSPRAFAVALKVFLRTCAARLRSREVLTNGASLIGQILKP